ncbi:MAG: hypothetical protein GXP55_18680, partial [Deltaproteobacteria bacterium]|nr:hypothetical protein [Deltaproteobacteria bacterium]
VVAFSLSLWWGADRTPQASAPDPRPAPTSAIEAATAAARPPSAPAEQVTESATQVPSPEQVEVSGADAGAVDPRPHGLRPHSGMNHGKSRPSHAAGLDQNPY